ncbi:MAG: YbaN family protein [Lachnospiraceae bacterium]|nr:YbaN family protein [Lachnospiraceae bacterium]
MRNAQTEHGRGLRTVLLFVGTVTFILGTLGIVLPLLPTVPFYLLTAACFARGSRRMSEWFLSSRWYRVYVMPYKNRDGMSWYTKIMILLGVTILLGIGFWRMESIPVGRVIVAVVWLCHLVFFLRFMRTIPRAEELERMRIQEEILQEEEERPVGDCEQI